MKKVISLLLALIMILSLLPVSAFAADGETPVKIDYETTFTSGMKAGDEFTVTVKVTQNPSIGSLTVPLTWNDKVVSFEGFETDEEEGEVYYITDFQGGRNPWFMEFGDETGIVTAAISTNKSTTGILCVAKFKVIAGGELGIGIDAESERFVCQRVNDDNSATTIPVEFGTKLNGLTAAGETPGPEYDSEWPFTAIDTALGKAMEIEEIGEHTVNVWGTNRAAFLYRVVIPQGAEYADVTFPLSISDFMTENRDGVSYISGYAGAVDGAGGGASFEYEELDASTTRVRVPMELVDSWGEGSYTILMPDEEDMDDEYVPMMGGPEYQSYEAVCYFIFEYGDAPAPTPPPHEHTYDQSKVEDKYLISAATCTELAVYHKSCSCGEFDASNKTAIFRDEAAGYKEHNHSLENTNNAGAQKSEATCQSPAVYYKSCSCGDIDKSENAATFTHGTKVDCVYVNEKCKWCGTAQPTYIITALEADHGSVSATVSGNTVTEVIEGKVVTLVAEPEDGYRQVSFTVTADGAAVKVTNNTFTMPAKDVTISATFEQIPTYKITLDPAMVGGTIELKNEDGHVITEAMVGQIVAVHVIPDAGYKSTGIPVLRCGQNDLSIDNGAFNMPEGDAVIGVSFAKLNYTIQVEQKGEGTVTVTNQTNSQSGSFQVGDTVALAAQPAAGYLVGEVTATLDDGSAFDGIGSTFAMPAGNLTITVTFKQENKIEAVTPRHSNIKKDDQGVMTMSIAEGVSEVLKAVIDTVIDGVEATQTIYWQSQDPTIAEVDSVTGKITAHKAGNTKIRAYIQDYVSPIAGDVQPVAEITLNVTEVPAGYTVTLDQADTTVKKGQSVSVPVVVSYKDEEGKVPPTAYNAYEFTVRYDAATLELTNQSAVTGDNEISIENDAENGIATIRRYGKDLGMGTQAIELIFTAKEMGEGYVKLDTAKVAASREALSQNIQSVGILDNLTQVTVDGYAVTLPDDFTGAKVADPTKPYTFYINTADFEYTFQVLVDGKAVTYTGDGTQAKPFTIAQDDVKGNIVVELLTKTGKKYDVAINGDAANCMAPVGGLSTGTDAAEYGKPYKVKLTPAGDKEYTVSITIGGAEKIYLPDEDKVYTIPGTDITGDIVITVNEAASAVVHAVTFTGRGKADVASGASEVQDGASYSFKLNKAAGFAYTITASVGTTAVDVNYNETDETYTIDNVTAALTIAVDKTDREVKVLNYINLPNKHTMFLVKATETLFEGEVLTFDNEMMYVKGQTNVGKQAWHYLVIVGAEAAEAAEGQEEGTELVATLTDLDANARITIKTLGEDEEIKSFQGSFDVNESGTVDINDAQLVYDMYKGLYTAFTGEATMSKFLRADTNDLVGVDTQDAQAVVSEILALKAANN